MASKTQVSVVSGKGFCGTPVLRQIVQMWNVGTTLRVIFSIVNGS